MSANDQPRAGLGIPGLDEILHGGLIPSRLYLVDGNPGAGKTTLALHFLREGVRAGNCRFSSFAAAILPADFTTSSCAKGG